ncbi:CDP-glycerol glycerophosphotransferase family protein [Microbacterium sp.]|uniref:CDP-glycerol glycerophosphotransferase family protein n=1 Tax=Microbacterium sp. TaxID=51671 RepID=UPI003A84572F
MRRFLRRSRLLRAVRFLPYAVPYHLLSRGLRVRDDRYLFLSDSSGDFAGNLAFLRDELIRQRPDAEVVGVFKNGLRTPRRLRDIVRLPYLMATSRAIVLDDFYPLIYPLRIRPDTRLVQVWHAAGAFKQVGHSRAGLPGGPVPGSNIHRNYTDATVSSEGIRADYAEAYGIDVSRVHALGVPRTDAFFDAARVDATARRVRERLDVGADDRLVLFAPTFRGNGQLSAVADGTVDPARLAAALGPGYRLAVRPHPFVASPPLPDGVIDASGGDMNDLLMATDVLVTDYSSSIFEFALLDRPIVLFAPDLDEYVGARSFYRPFEHYALGPVVTDPAGLAEAIRAAEVDPQRRAAFAEEFTAGLDGRSSERIVRSLLLAPPPGANRATIAPGAGELTPTRVEGAIGVNVAAAHAIRALMRAVYAPLKLLPLRRKVVMLSREHSSVPDDFVDLAEAIARADPQVTVVMLVKMVPPGGVARVRYIGHVLRQLYHVATARVLIVDTYAVAASMLRHRPELTVMQIWHALGAFKKFGSSILGRPEGRDVRLSRAMRMHEGYDVVLTSSERSRAAFAEALNTPIDRVAVSPLPRVDRLRDPRRRAAMRDLILAAHPHLADGPIAVFAPTFRLDGSISVDPGELTATLREVGYHTVTKLHPLMGRTLDSAVDTAPGFSTQDLLAIADVFITDYSSVVFEAALYAVPQYFLAPDLDDYLEARDFYLDYRHDLPGPVVSDLRQLAASLAAAEATAEDAEAFGRTWVEVPDAPPAAGHTPCADAIAARVLAGLEARAATHRRRTGRDAPARLQSGRRLPEAP